MIKLVRIVISRFGRIKEEMVDSTLRIMVECYGRLMPHRVELVDLCLFERSSAAEAFLSREGAEAGVASTSFGELFFATHEAWRGTPRITLCFERMMGLPRRVKVGGIRHEVGHSVLHGGLEHYLLSLPPGLLGLTERFSLPLEYAMNLLYLTSIAVKDYEVTRLLHERGYVRGQVAYAEHLLRVSEGDVLSWELARGRPLAEILCLVSSMKALSCAAPLLLDKAWGGKIKQRLRAGLSHIPQDRSAPILRVVLEDLLPLGTDTLNNIRHITDLLAEKVVKPLLQG